MKNNKNGKIKIMENAASNEIILKSDEIIDYHDVERQTIVYADRQNSRRGGAPHEKPVHIRHPLEIERLTKAEYLKGWKDSFRALANLELEKLCKSFALAAET